MVLFPCILSVAIKSIRISFYRYAYTYIATCMRTYVSHAKCFKPSGITSTCMHHLLHVFSTCYYCNLLFTYHSSNVNFILIFFIYSWVMI